MWTPASVLIDCTTKAAKNEQADPHKIATGTAIRTEGPKKRSVEPGMQVEER